MDAVTYPNEDVVKTVENHLVPIRSPYGENPLKVDYHVSWTPDLFIIDADGKYYFNNIGFLPPEEFIPWLILGCGRMHFDRNELDQSLSFLNSLIEMYADSKWAPEALYFSGVAKYKRENDGIYLKETYEQLRRRHPQSIWAQKVRPYRLL